MAVVYTNAVKIARMNAVTTAAGTTAVLEIGTAGMATVLATINLGNPIAAAFRVGQRHRTGHRHGRVGSRHRLAQRG